MPQNTQPTADILKLVRPDILAMLAYEPVEPSEQLAERLGIAPDKIVKLDANENPYGPSPLVVKALAEFKSYHRYSDPHQRKLRAALAEYMSVDAEQIVAGHGSDELIDVLLRAVITPGDGAIECPPTFGMYSFLTRVAGGQMIEVPRRDDFSLDVGEVKRAAANAKIVFVASPNNPTGGLLPREELDGLLATGLLVVIDEAYGEFAGESYAPLVSEKENLVVLRTFSKWAGLAGLRAGYGIMPPALARVLAQIRQPYTPNVAAEIAMLASLEDKERLLEAVRAIVQERERMRERLTALEFVEVYPSETNFLLCRLSDLDAHEVHGRLAERGILVRYYDSPNLRDAIRISVGLPGDTDRLVEELQEIGESRGR